MSLQRRLPKQNFPHLDLPDHGDLTQNPETASFCLFFFPEGLSEKKKHPGSRRTPARNLGIQATDPWKLPDRRDQTLAGQPLGGANAQAKHEPPSNMVAVPEPCKGSERRISAAVDGQGIILHLHLPESVLSTWLTWLWLKELGESLGFVVGFRPLVEGFCPHPQPQK